MYLRDDNVADHHVLHLLCLQSGRPGDQVQDNCLSLSTAAEHFPAGWAV